MGGHLKKLIFDGDSGGGGGGDITVQRLDVADNGTYTAPLGKAYSPVVVSVPQTTVEQLNVSANDTYTAPSGKAYSPVVVSVPQTTVEQLNVSVNDTYTAPSGKAYSPVVVNVPQTTVEQLNVSANDTYTAPSGKAYSPVVVNVPQVTVSPLSVTQNGTYTPASGTAYGPVEVNVSGGAPAEVEPNDVNFYDYDGTIVASYSAEDFAQLSALPANPSHTGLTAQGWNWSLADAQAYVGDYAAGDIGQLYAGNDGKTVLRLNVRDPEKKNVSLTFEVAGSNPSLSIDWGDGSALDTLPTMASTWTRYHNYTTTGVYEVAFIPANGCELKLGTSNSSYNMFENIGNQYGGLLSSYLESVVLGNNVTEIKQKAFAFCYSLQKIAVSAGVSSIGQESFRDCLNLCHISLPNGVLSVEESAFYNCISLKSISLPNSISQCNSYCFQNCKTLRRVTFSESIQSIPMYMLYDGTGLNQVVIPDSVTSISVSGFQACKCLGTVKIPSSVTGIAGNAFFNCTSLSSIYFASTTPPTVYASGAFGSIGSTCKIYVPTGSLSAYTSASNYPDPNTYTYVEY